MIDPFDAERYARQRQAAFLEEAERWRLLSTIRATSPAAGAARRARIEPHPVAWLREVVGGAGHLLIALGTRLQGVAFAQ